MVRSNNNGARQRALNRSYMAEAEDDLNSAKTEIEFARQFDDWLAVKRAAKFAEMAERRLREAVEKAVPPEGQEVLGK